MQVNNNITLQYQAQQPMPANINNTQLELNKTDELLLNFDQSPNLESKIIFIIGLMYRNGHITVDQRTTLKQALFQENDQLIQSCQQIEQEKAQQLMDAKKKTDRIEQYGWIIQSIVDRMCEQLKWCAGPSNSNTLQQMDGEINNSGQVNLNFSDINKAAVNNIMSNSMGRVQGRNLQVLHGMQGTTKVSETRDSSYQGISGLQNSGMGVSLQIPQQNNFNQNQAEFDDLSSPMDNVLMKNKKQNLSLRNMNEQQNKQNVGGKDPGLRINTLGLSIMGTFKACNEGMSPLMQRFQKNKYKVAGQQIQ